ncbi:hypothetical protein BDR04DRAFT_1091119 [Suillus decipiens]|nr:hypothetical protein BDR04DRAFT_1091119 [Suillus decipiens]
MTVAEGSTSLRSPLLLCYPTATPTFNGLDDAKAILKAVKQYDMQAALSRVGDFIIVQFLPDHTLDLYALCCRFGWQHHAQTAATCGLEIKDLGRPSNGFNGLQDITGADYHNIIIDAASSLKNSETLFPGYHRQLEKCNCKCGCANADSRAVSRRSILETSAR